MARPERRVVLAGVRPARVSAGAPGSRLQPGGEIRPCQAECRKPWKERGANQRAATNRERNSLVTSSAERCWEGRVSHVTAKATDSILDRNGCWTSPGSQAAARWDRTTRNRRDPTWRPSRAKTGRRRPEGGNRAEAGRESERLVVPGKACQKTRWREGALLGSGWTGGKGEGLPETANTPHEKVRQLPRKL